MTADETQPQALESETPTDTRYQACRMLRYFRVLPSLRTFCQQGAPEAPRAPMLHLMNAAVAQVDLSSGLSSGSSASSFDRLVLHGDKTLLVMFGAPWCSHCKTLAVSCSPLLPVTLLARLTAFVSCIA